MAYQNRIYHVSKTGSDQNDGGESTPLLTIRAAAQRAKDGDTVIVHEGEYREWVAPTASGVSYIAEPTHGAVIKGSEYWEDWQAEENGIYRAEIPHAFFGGHNPFAEEIFGDWFRPGDRKHHTGMVYQNGEALFEAESKDALLDEKDAWYAECGKEQTTVWASFSEPPAPHGIEINVRKYCFFPAQTGVDRITVRGFRMCHAATNWAPPTALQEGLIGPHWSYGWVIENNIIHDARCVGISLGKEAATGQNPATLIREKPGFNYQLEVVFKGLRAGWRKGVVGSHLVQNNLIYNCGQAGIVGHMGCAFSKISGNRIYSIHQKESFAGAEIAAIKLHAAIDVIIEGNVIHDSARFGIWLDWQNQGVRISRNLFYRNMIDLFIEVCHGPCLVDNNLFLSENSLQIMAQGSAFAHNLFLGRISTSDVMARATPYHFPHETDVMGTELIFGGDDRFYNNIFYGPREAKAILAEEKEKTDEALGEEETGGSNFGLLEYRSHPLGEVAYRALIDKQEATVGIGFLSTFRAVKQPLYAEGNLYALGANEIEGEEGALVCPDFDPAVRLCEEMDGIYLHITADRVLAQAKGESVTTARLGKPRFPEAAYENPDGSPLILNRDFLNRERAATPTVGPFEELREGENIIRLV